MSEFSTNIASSVVKTVKKECLVKGTPIPSNCLILLLFRLLALECRTLNDSQKNTQNLTESLTEKVMKFFVSPQSFSVATLQIQIYFNQNHRPKEFILNKYNEKLKKNTEPLLDHILRRPNVKNKEDCDQLYHHISAYVLFVSGIGDPNDINILKETIVALKSVLSTKELTRFISKPIQLKEKQLADLCRIVTGIKIYNKNCSNKVNDVNDLPSTLGTNIKHSYTYLEKKLREVEENTSSFIYLASQFYSYNLSSSVLDSKEFTSVPTETEKQLKSCIIFLQQLSFYLRILIQENNVLCNEFHSCFLELQQRLARIRKTVKFRTAIPVIEIYPQFKDLSLTWDKIQELTVRFSNLSEIVSYFQKFHENVSEPELGIKITEPLVASPKIENEPVIVISPNGNCQLVTPENDQNFYEISVQYSGFCSVTFVDSNGILVSGIKEYGLVKYRNLHYCFCSVDAMNKFCQKPDRYIDTMKKLAFVWPEVINLLQLEKSLEEEKAKSRIVSLTKQQNSKDTAVQTDIHPLSSLKDNNHDTSMWQLKKRFEHLVRIKNSQTKSAQTDVSIFRKDRFTQTIIK